MKNSEKKQTLRIAITVTLITAAVLILDFFRIKYLGSGCISKALFNISCPACGMTRAFLSVFLLDFRAAFYYNPAWWTVPIAALACAMTFFDKKRTKVWVTVFACALAVIIGVWIFRLVMGTAV